MIMRTDKITCQPRITGQPDITIANEKITSVTIWYYYGFTINGNGKCSTEGTTRAIEMLKFNSMRNIRADARNK